MRLPCKEKDVNLHKFYDAVEEFFKVIAYKTNRTCVEDGCIILGRPIDHRKKQVPVKVIIIGQPNDFTIEFAPWEDEKLPVSVSILGLFGGTLRVRDHYERKEKIRELEEKFWSHALSALKDSTRTMDRDYQL